MSARPTNEGEPARPQRHQLGDELGERPIPTHALKVRAGASGVQLATAVRLVKGRGLTSDEVRTAARRARLLSQAPHPNLARMREVVVGTAEVLLVGDFVDGESLQSLWQKVRESGRQTQLELSVRVLLDALAGLARLHQVGAGHDQESALLHGELTSSNVIVGIDGIGRLIHTCRIPGISFKIPGAAPYLAPEILLQEPTIDLRADVYSAGILLWEAIAGVPLFATDKTSDIIRKMLAGSLPPPPVGASQPWAAALLPVVAKAISIDPTARYATADAMRLELLSRAAGHVADASRVAQWVRTLAGARIQERRLRHGGAPLELPTADAPDAPFEVARPAPPARADALPAPVAPPRPALREPPLPPLAMPRPAGAPSPQVPPPPPALREAPLPPLAMPRPADVSSAPVPTPGLALPETPFPPPGVLPLEEEAPPMSGRVSRRRAFIAGAIALGVLILGGIVWIAASGSSSRELAAGSTALSTSPLRPEESALGAGSAPASALSLAADRAQLPTEPQPSDRSDPPPTRAPGRPADNAVPSSGHAVAEPSSADFPTTPDPGGAPAAAAPRNQTKSAVPDGTTPKRRDRGSGVPYDPLGI